MAYKKTRTNLAYTTKTATFNGDVFRADQADYLTLTCTTGGTISGTSPTLDVKLQQSPDDGTTWVDVPSGAIAQFTGTSAQTKTLAVSPPIPKYLRPVFTIGGTTPSYGSISLTVEHHRLGHG